MKKLFLALALACALPLTACNQSGIQSASTQAAIGANATYTAASRFGQDMVALGKLDVTTYKALDNRAYTALLAVRAAQKAASAADIATTTVQMSAAIAALYAAVHS